jgi:hypothetical protein
MTLLGQFNQKRTPVYDKKPRGYPLLLEVFWSIFGLILVQNGLLWRHRGPISWGSRPKFEDFFKIQEKRGPYPLIKCHKKG